MGKRSSFRMGGGSVLGDSFAWGIENRCRGGRGVVEKVKGEVVWWGSRRERQILGTREVE